MTDQNDELDTDTTQFPCTRTVTVGPEHGTYRIELPDRGIDFEIDAELRFRLLDALDDAGSTLAR